MVVGDLFDVEGRVIFRRAAVFEEIEQTVESDRRAAIGGPVETVTHDAFLPCSNAKSWGGGMCHSLARSRFGNRVHPKMVTSATRTEERRVGYECVSKCNISM